MIDVLSPTLEQATNKARHTRLALFLSQATLPDIDALRLTAIRYAELIYQQSTPASVKSSLLLGLEESLHELKTAVQSDGTHLNVALPKALLQYTRSDKLLTDYHESTFQAHRGTMYHLDIPIEKITGVNVLPFASNRDNYSPTLDIRVQSSSDAALNVYNPVGADTLIPNPGTWHRLPLAYVELALDVSV